MAKPANKTNDKEQHKDNDSIAEACLPFADLLAGETKHVSFDCPENLRKAFKSATKANGTTYCHVLRGFMQTYVVASHYRKACFPNTNEPVVVENLFMPTLVRKRLRRVLEEVEEVSFLEYSTCEFPKCKHRGIWGVLRQKGGFRSETKCCKECFQKWKDSDLYEVLRAVSDD